MMKRSILGGIHTLFILVEVKRPTEARTMIDSVRIQGSEGEREGGGGEREKQTHRLIDRQTSRHIDRQKYV